MFKTNTGDILVSPEQTIANTMPPAASVENLGLTSPLTVTDIPSGENLAVAETSLATHHGRYMSILFFLCGLGSSLCYIGILSSLVYFSSEYGDASFVYLNLAAYLPLLPVSIIQAKYDQLYDEKYGSKKSFLFRGLVGYVICIGAMAAVPLRIGLFWVCAQTFLMGTAGAVLQGLLFQMAAFMLSSTDLSGTNSLKPAVSAGIQGSALLTLVVSVLIGRGSPVHESQQYFKRFCFAISSAELVVLLIFRWLMRLSQVETSMVRRDSYFITASQDVEMENAGLGTQYISTNLNELSYRQLWTHTSSICASLFLTLIPSFLVGSWFTMIKSHNEMLPQILFYVRIGSDFLARLYAGYKPLSSSKELLFISATRIFLVVAFFVNAASDAFQYRDILSIVLVANIAFGSGYLVTGCYQLAPVKLPDEMKETNAAKQAALLNVAFSFSALLGILSSLGLTYVSTAFTSW